MALDSNDTASASDVGSNVGDVIEQSDQGSGGSGQQGDDGSENDSGEQESPSQHNEDDSEQHGQQDNQGNQDNEDDTAQPGQQDNQGNQDNEDDSEKHGQQDNQGNQDNEDDSAQPGQQDNQQQSSGQDTSSGQEDTRDSGQSVIQNMTDQQGTDANQNGDDRQVPVTDTDPPGQTTTYSGGTYAPTSSWTAPNPIRLETNKMSQLSTASVNPIVTNYFNETEATKIPDIQTEFSGVTIGQSDTVGTTTQHNEHPIQSRPLARHRRQAHASVYCAVPL